MEKNSKSLIISGCNEKTLTIILITISCFLFFSEVLIIKPGRYGDSYEYLFMTRAFQNHFSPNITDGDISSLQTTLKQNKIEEYSSYYKVFFSSNTGKVFSFHFWFYSLLCSPIMGLLEWAHLNVLLTFQIINTLFFVTAIWTAFLGLKSFGRKRIYLVFFLLASPVIWYLVWWTPEVFSFSLVVISLVFYYNKRYYWAIFLAAIASAQNPPILFISILFVIRLVCENHSKLKIKNILLIFASAMPIMIPSLFYYYNFRTTNLILQNERAGFQFITFQKIIDFFFDLNLGILPYMTIIILLFFIVLLISFVNIPQKPYRVFLIIVIFLMIIFSIQTDNWNNDMAGINRYAIWILPIFVFLIVLEGFDLSKFVRLIYFIGILLQAIILIQYGGLKCSLRYTQLSDLSVFVLDHFPQLYSPSPEIFTERVAGVDYLENSSVSVFYANEKGEVRKAISDKFAFDYLKSLNHVSLDIVSEEEFNNIYIWLNQADGRRYIDFPNTVIRIRSEYLRSNDKYQSIFFP